MYTLARASCRIKPVDTSAVAQRLPSLYNFHRCRSTLSRIWVPTGGIAETENESGHEKLVRAGFLRQSQAGIFQFLPLGLRVQKKIEKLIDKHMESIGRSHFLRTCTTTHHVNRSIATLIV